MVYTAITWFTGLYNKEVRVRVCEVVDALKYHTPTPDEQF
jgi:hypothetical protein